MREDWRETLLNRFYALLPLLFSVVLIALSFLPLNSSLADNARPAVGLMCVYFWLIYRPDLFNLGNVFILGIFADIVSSVPFGSSLIAMLVMYLLVTNLIKYLNGRVFVVLWVGIAVLLPICLLTQWLLLSVYYTQLMPFLPLFFSYLLSLALYPIVGGINALVLNIFLQDD